MVRFIQITRGDGWGTGRGLMEDGWRTGGGVRWPQFCFMGIFQILAEIQEFH